MKKTITLFILSFLAVSCANYGTKTALERNIANTFRGNETGNPYNTTGPNNKTIVVQTQNINLIQAYSDINKETAADESLYKCKNSGGVSLGSFVKDMSPIFNSAVWESTTVCYFQATQPERTTYDQRPEANDPNAQFCHLRSNERKCTEIGSCQWVAPKTSLCKARAGYENDPNGKFCHLRSTAQKCGEIGSCEFIAAERNGHCQAR